MPLATAHVSSGRTTLPPRTTCSASTRIAAALSPAVHVASSNVLPVSRCPGFAASTAPLTPRSLRPTRSSSRRRRDTEPTSACGPALHGAARPRRGAARAGGGRGARRLRRLRARRVDDAAEGVRGGLPGRRLPRDAGARLGARAAEVGDLVPRQPGAGAPDRDGRRARLLGRGRTAARRARRGRGDGDPHRGRGRARGGDARPRGRGDGGRRRRRRQRRGGGADVRGARPRAARLGSRPGARPRRRGARRRTRRGEPGGGARRRPARDGHARAARSCSRRARSAPAST